MSDPSDPSSAETNLEPKPAPAPPIPPAPATPATPPTPPPPGQSPGDWGSGPNPPGRHGGGIFFGVLLVVIGAIFLVGQFAPGLNVAWWALWPLIIVIAGVVQVFTPGEQGWGVSRVFDGLGTVFFGLILLGCTTGYISWSVWWTVLTLWPALVIAAGLAIMGAGLQMTWLKILATLVVWATLLYAVSVSWTGMSGVPVTGVWMRTGGQEFSYSEKGSGVTKATLTYRGGAGAIGISDGNDLVSVSGVSPYGAPTFSAAQTGSSARVEIGVGQSSMGPVIVPGTVGSRTKVDLSDEAVWDATLETGASSLDADLSHVKVRDMVLSTGVSSVVLRLGDVPPGVDESTLLVKAGVSSVRILLPRDADARLSTANGLVGTSVGGDFERVDGTWETPGADSADQVWNIRTQAGVGSVTIETY